MKDSQKQVLVKVLLGIRNTAVAILGIFGWLFHAFLAVLTAGLILSLIHILKEGKLYVEPYEYYDRDAIFICSADTLLKLAAGKLDPVFAFTTGKRKVEGSLEKALMLQKFV